ncbi:hypothetical protein Fmac_024613 [Flemingia macrophylla]|uniref:Uncharacterized protein n=1 Tax=Flemingia macrophylla TaxID=520843 RepID=A0ABD1LPX7_9FABA
MLLSNLKKLGGQGFSSCLLPFYPVAGFYSLYTAPNALGHNRGLHLLPDLGENRLPQRLRIRPMKLSRHLQRVQVLAPLVDLEEEEEENDDVRGRYVRPGRRRTRSLSPLRNKWSENKEKK